MAGKADISPQLGIQLAGDRGRYRPTEEICERPYASALVLVWNDGKLYILAIRVGRRAIVTLVGEPFVKAQLDTKLRSPARYTFVAHFCNGYAGYIPTPEALRRGGRESKTNIWSRFDASALEEITECAVRLLLKLFEKA